MPEFEVTSTLLIVARVTALALIVPGLGFPLIPWRIRIALIGLLSIAASATCQPMRFETAQMPSLLAHEFIVGCSLAMVPAVMVWGTQLAARTLHGMAGLPGTGDAGGSGSLASSPLTNLLHMAVIVVFFLSGGHRQVIQGLIESFRWLPPGEQVQLHSARELLVDMLSQSFALGVRAISPLMVAMLMSFTALALLQRLIPQLGHFVIGMNVQVLVLLGSMAVLVGAVFGSLDGAFADLAHQLSAAGRVATSQTP